MIIVPDLKVVVILTPRTGSSALYRAVMKRWPNAMMLYRHMEADGVPRGYESYLRVGVVRHPVHRIWSLYKYLCKLVKEQDEGTASYRIHERVLETYRNSLCAETFDDSLQLNTAIFPYPHFDITSERLDPLRNVMRAVPENAKSQWHYIRPDLGGKWYSYESGLPHLCQLLRIEMEHHNGSNKEPCPNLSQQSKDYVLETFAWEMSLGYNL